MADFSREPARTPTTIGRIEVTLTTYRADDEAHPVSFFGGFELEVQDQDGVTIAVRRGQLSDHLSAPVMQQVEAFMGNLRTRAQKLITG